MSLNTQSEENSAGIHFDLDKNTKETHPPSEFKGVLKPYQAKALTWMLYREGKKQ